MFGAVGAGAVFPIMFAVFGSLTDVFNREEQRSLKCDKRMLISLGKK